MKKTIGVVISTLLVAVLVLQGCGSDAPADPKAAVIKLFGAMEKNDQAALAHLLDLPALMKEMNADYALQTEEPRVFTNPQQILEDLTNDGKTKKRWFALQRIVNDAEINGESATVEVTFVDKENSKGYRTKFGLHIVNGKWKIYSFKTFDEGQ